MFRLPKGLAFSDDLRTWTDHQIIMTPRPGSGWDSKSIGSNGMPIRTDHGWLLFYHGYDADHVYRHSIALLDLHNPAQVIHRPADFILEPEETWELRGDVPNALFSCSNNIVGDEVWVYYAGADRLIGLATVQMEEAVAFARHG